MKNLSRLPAPLLALSVLTTTLVASAQTAPSSAPTTSPTTAPAARPNTALIPNLNAGFMTKHNQYLEIAKKADSDLLFMGDSITDLWRNARAAGNAADAAPYAGKAVFDKYFGAMKVANFGISGDTTQGVLWRLQNGEGAGIKPKAVMLMIGTNNTGRNTPAEIAIGIAAVVYELRKDFPDAKILLLAVFPRGPATSVPRQQITEINHIIPALHDNQHVFYLDIGEKFLAPDGSIPKDIMSDALHPTSKGYEIWANAVKDKLDELMK